MCGSPCFPEDSVSGSHGAIRHSAAVEATVAIP